MANPLDFLRFQNIYGGGNQGMWGNDLPSQGGITGNMPPSMTPPALNDISMPPGSIPQTFGNVPPAMAAPSQPQESEIDRAMKLYHPETAATERFNQLVSQYPRQEDYHPSIMRSILAGLTSFGPGGQQMAQQVLNEPYTDKLADWQRQIGPTQQAANLERYENVNQRQYAYQTAHNQLMAEAENDRRNKNEADARVKEFRAKIYKWKAENPGDKLIAPKGGNYMFENPVTHVQTPVLDDLGKPIATGTLSREDELNLMGSNALDLAGTKAAYASDLEEQRQGGREAIAKIKDWELQNIQDPSGRTISAWVSPSTHQMIPTDKGPVQAKVSGAYGGRGELPSQTRIRQFNAAQQLYNTNPELRPFIKLDVAAKTFDIQPPSEGFFGHSGPTPEQMNKIQQAIYGGDIAISQPGRTGATPTSTPSSQATPTSGTPVPVEVNVGGRKRRVMRAPGTIAVMSKDGKDFFSVPDTPEQRNLLKTTRPDLTIIGE